MTRGEMLREIEEADRMVSAGRIQYPAFGPLRDVAEALHWLRERVQAQWPLSNSDRGRVELGQFAVRNLDDILPSLVVQLVRVGRLAKEGGTALVP